MISPVILAVLSAHLASDDTKAQEPPSPPPAVLAVDEKRGIILYFDDASPRGMCRQEYVLVDRARAETFNAGEECPADGKPASMTPLSDAAKQKLAANAIDVAKQPKWTTTPVPEQKKGKVRWEHVSSDGDDCAIVYLDEKEAYRDCQARDDMGQFGMSSTTFFFWRIASTRLFLELSVYSGRDVAYNWSVADAAVRDADDAASYAGTNVDVAAIRAIQLPAGCNATIAANGELRNAWGVTGAMAKALSRDEKKKPVPVSTAKKHRKASVVYATKACAETANAVAAKVPGGATVEPLLWKSKGGIVVALGADAQPRF